MSYLPSRSGVLFDVILNFPSLSTAFLRMSKVFISYAHVEPDQQLAAKLSHFLEANGFEVFVDSKIRVGQDWVEQIDSQLRNSVYFVVLLSRASVKSDMVRREIAIAYKLRKAHQLAILPIRLGFEEELPYEVGAYLDLIQYVAWQPDEPFDPICRTILASMQKPSGTEAPLSFDPIRFNSSDLDHLKRELARYVGPVARVIVDRAAKKATNWEQLYNSLAAEIPAGDERKRFLAIRRP